MNKIYSLFFIVIIMISFFGNAKADSDSDLYKAKVASVNLPDILERLRNLCVNGGSVTLSLIEWQRLSGANCQRSEIKEWGIGLTNCNGKLYCFMHLTPAPGKPKICLVSTALTTESPPGTNNSTIIKFNGRIKKILTNQNERSVVCGF